MTIIGKLKGTKKTLPVLAANKTLFVLVLITVFFVPFIPVTFHRITYSILLTSIILTRTQLLSKHRTFVLSFAVVAIAMVWIGEMLALYCYCYRLTGRKIHQPGGEITTLN